MSDGSNAGDSTAGNEPTNRFIVESGLARLVADLIDEPLQALGYRLVRVHVMSGKEQTLQIMAERPDGSMSIDDCETVSRQLSPLLDAHDPLPGTYRLEVSSPGIDRPLVRPGDFDSWAGHIVKVELNTLVDGRRRFKGQLEGFVEGEIRLEVDLGDQGRQLIGLPLDLVHEARLVLTDELVRESLRRAKETGVTGEVGDGSEAPEGADLHPVQLKN